jgi:hypothetical protein
VAVVAAEDLRAARDEFLETIQRLGGRVTSETVTTDGSTSSSASTDIATYPPTPVNPGIQIAVEVPAEAYDQAVAVIPTLGDVVSFSASSVDRGTEIADVEARIKALQASVATLEGLMDRAQSISQVIRLEGAIAERQAELDGLTAQQRYLQDQVSQARISLELISPDDAATRYGDGLSGWESFLDGLAAAWQWVGWLLLVTSPLWLVAIGIWMWRRRRR